jgi:hypothetical protein
MIKITLTSSRIIAAKLWTLRRHLRVDTHPPPSSARPRPSTSPFPRSAFLPSSSVRLFRLRFPCSYSFGLEPAPVHLAELRPVLLHSLPARATSIPANGRGTTFRERRR